MSQYSSVQVEIDTHCKFWGFLWIIYNICSEDICFILLIDLGLNGESLHVWFFFFYVCTSSMYFLFLPSVPSTKMWKPFKYNHLGVISVKLHNPFTLSHKVEVSSLAERLWLVELCSSYPKGILLLLSKVLPSVPSLHCYRGSDTQPHQSALISPSFL